MEQHPILSSGKKMCVQESLITIRLSTQAFEFGEAADILKHVFFLVHQLNRHSEEHRIALDLPNFDTQKNGLQRFGNVIQLAGPKTMMENILDNKALKRLSQNGAIFISSASHEYLSGVLKRSRTGEKSTKAGISRSKRRFEKRHGNEKSFVRRQHNGQGLPTQKTAFITFGNKKIAFYRETNIDAANISTYGMA